MKAKIFICFMLSAACFLIASSFVAAAEQVPFISMPRLDDNIDINIDADINIGESTQVIEPTVALEEVYEKLREILLNRGIIEESTLFYTRDLNEIELIDTINLGYRFNEEENIRYPVYTGGFVLKKEKNSAMTYEWWHWEFNGLTGESNYLKKFSEVTFQNIKTKEQVIELLRRGGVIFEGIRVEPYYYFSEKPRWIAYLERGKAIYVYDDGTIEEINLPVLQDLNNNVSKQPVKDSIYLPLILIGGIAAVILVVIFLIKIKK